MYYVVRELIPNQVYDKDRADLNNLGLLRNTCKLFQSQVPVLYHRVCLLDKLKSQVDGWLFRLAINIAPELPFHNNWQRHYFEFSIPLTERRKIVLWSARADYDGLHIVESPAKAPNVCFELSLLPFPTSAKDVVIASSLLSKTGPPSVKKDKITTDTWETVMAMYKDNFSMAVIAGKKEVEENEDNYASLRR